ncbi:MAG TPA: hypothetical protein VEH05_13085 [Streptosporangiaceae bacterium]|nr:hypothetical protein [Streptosporangiaceae bacterium]
MTVLISRSTGPVGWSGAAGGDGAVSPDRVMGRPEPIGPASAGRADTAIPV